MTQVDAFGIAAVGTVTLMFASRRLQRFGLSFETKLWMALAWLLLIVSGAMIAAAWVK